MSDDEPRRSLDDAYAAIIGLLLRGRETDEPEQRDPNDTDAATVTSDPAAGR